MQLRLRKPRLISLPSVFANVGFLLLFPVFALYHLGVASGNVPPLVGGLFGVTSLLVGALYVTYYIFLPQQISRLNGWYFLLAFFFFLYCGAWIFLHWLTEMNSVAMHATGVQALESLVLMVVLFFIGLYLNLYGYRFNFLLIGVFLLSTIMSTGYSMVTGDAMFYAARDLVVSDGVTSYQGFARSVAVVGIFCLSIVNRIFFKLFIASAGLISLYLLGARSEFLGFLIISLVVGLLMRGNFSARFLIGIIVPTLLVVGVSQLPDYFGQNRILEVFNLGAASSWAARLQMQDIALTQIVESPVVGQFGGHVKRFGTTGSYAHNALSAWVSYGIFGFVTYIGLTGFAVLRSLHAILKGVAENRRKWEFAFLLNLFCLALMVGAKSVFWPIPALGWGVFLGAALGRKLGRSQAPPEPGRASGHVLVPR